MKDIVKRPTRHNLVGMQSCNGSHIYCHCVVLLACRRQGKSVNGVQITVDRLENRGNCENEGNASSRQLTDKEMFHPTCIEMPINATDNQGGEHQPLHDSVSSDMECTNRSTTSMKNNPQKVKVFALSCECGMPQVDTVVEVSEMTSEVYEQSESTTTSALISKVDGWMEALEEVERRVDLNGNAVAQLWTQFERLLDEIVSTRAELDEQFPPPENSLADMPPSQTEHLGHWNQEGMHGTEHIFELAGASASARCVSRGSVSCEADEGATIEWSSVEEECRSDSVLLSSSDLLQTHLHSRAATSLESGCNSVDYAHPDSSVLFRADIDLVLQNLLAHAARETEAASSSDDTSSSVDDLSCAEEEDVEIRSRSRADLDPTSEAMQSARDIYTRARAGEHAEVSHPLAPTIVESSEGMRSARSIYDATEKAGCESDNDSDSDGSSISQMLSQEQEMCREMSSTEDETDEDLEDSDDDHSTSDETEEEETCFDLDALFDSQRQIVGIEEVAGEQDPSKVRSITSSIEDLPASDMCPMKSPFEDDESETASELLEELERVLEELEEGVQIDVESIREGLLDLDPATLQCIGECAEGEDNDPSPQTEMNGKEKKKRWLKLRKLWKSSRSLRSRQSHGGAKGGLKFAKWCRKWAGKKTRKVFRFFMRTGSRKGEEQPQ